MGLTPIPPPGAPGDALPLALPKIPPLAPVQPVSRRSEADAPDPITNPQDVVALSEAIAPQDVAKLAALLASFPAPLPNTADQPAVVASDSAQISLPAATVLDAVLSHEPQPQPQPAPQDSDHPAGYAQPFASQATPRTPSEAATDHIDPHKASELRIEAAVKTIVEHARAGRLTEATTAIQQLARVAPQIVERLPDHVDLAPARSEITTLVHHLTVTAKATAEQAVSTLESRVPEVEQQVANWHTPIRNLVAICQDLIGFGGLTNYVKAERLAETVLADINDGVKTYIDIRGLPVRVPDRFGLLPQGSALGGMLLMVAIALIAAAYFLR